VKFWEVFWKDRIRLETSYSFSGAPWDVDEIHIVNLSGVTLQISHWKLEWKPNAFRWRTSPIDMTPEYASGMFTLTPHDRHTLTFDAEEKFDWSYRSAKHRNLYLTLYAFGRKRPLVLKVGAGQ